MTFYLSEYGSPKVHVQPVFVSLLVCWLNYWLIDWLFDWFFPRCEEQDKFTLVYALMKLNLLRGKSIIFVNEVNRCYK